MNVVRLSSIWACILVFPSVSAAADGDPWRLLSHTGQNAYVEYANFGALVDHMNEVGPLVMVNTYHYNNVQTQGVDHGAEYSSSPQLITVQMTGCLGTTCGISLSWSEEYVSNFCPAGNVHEGDVCETYEDYAFHRPTQCPWIGRPINPLTGVQRETVDLGIRVGPESLSLTYDTSSKLPLASGNSTWIVPAPPSFGQLWESNLHKNIATQAAAGGFDTAGTVAVNGGANQHESMLSVSQQSPCAAYFAQGWVPAQTSGFASLTDAQRSVHSLANGNALLVDAGAGSEQTYLPGGALGAVNYSTGGGLSYFYSTGVSDQAPVAGLLTSIQDQFGRTTNFYYEVPPAPWQFAPPRIRMVTAADGENISFEYDPAQAYLTAIDYPGSQVKLVYEQPALPWALTGIYDENNARNVTLSYDALGRASGSVEGTDASPFTITYPDDPLQGPHWDISQQIVTTASSQAVVCRIHTWVTPSTQSYTAPTGEQVQLSAATISGQPYLTGRSQAAGSGCSASTSSATFDQAGNQTVNIDFDGTRTCRAFDPHRNLETFRVEGLPAAKACPSDLSTYVPSPADGNHPERRISTTWHPDWALRLREAAPRKITTWVYNGQTDPITALTVNCAPATTLPDNRPLAVLCRKYEQATTDASGGAGLTDANNAGNPRVWAYTYNQFGQVLTEVAPKQVSTDPDAKYTTTTTYFTDTSFPDGVSGHTVGDLQSVRNPLGQMSRFTSYDKAGRLLASTDAKNTVTTRTYWPRGWLHTQTVAPAAGTAQTTTYDYWPTGLLNVATLPDGTRLTYLYDDAHRLTDVTDGAGNTVHYTLDNEGHRTGEQLKDASGKLAAMVTRVFDALGRVQAVTGATH